jgi:hypothetical protein
MFLQDRPGSSAGTPVPFERELDYHRRAMAGAKRVAATVLFMAIGPALVILVLVSPLITHRRVGHCGAALWMLKLRTM